MKIERINRGFQPFSITIQIECEKDIDMLRDIADMLTDSVSDDWCHIGDRIFDLINEPQEDV